MNHTARTLLASLLITAWACIAPAAAGAVTSASQTSDTATELPLLPEATTGPGAAGTDDVGWG